MHFCIKTGIGVMDMYEIYVAGVEFHCSRCLGILWQAGDSWHRTFVRLLDTFFDCLNLRSTKEFIHKRKANLAPYANVADVRFEV